MRSLNSGRLALSFAGELDPSLALGLRQQVRPPRARRLQRHRFDEEVLAECC
jgi:hypothetical protein